MYDTPSDDALTGMVIRIPAGDYQRVKRLSAATRVRQSEYLREAIADLLAKYRHLL